MGTLLKKKLDSEEAVKKALDIPDFRHMTKDKVVTLVSNLDRMDPEVAMKIIEQFPEVSRMALDLAKEQRAALKDTLDANDKSSQSTFALLNSVIEILSAELEKDNLTSEERMHIYDLLKELPLEGKKIHKMNQNLFLKGLATMAAVTGTIVIGAIAVLGISSKTELPSFDDDDDEDEI